MPAHYDLVCEGIGPEGIPETNLKVWYDDPEHEDPNWGERGNAFPVAYDSPGVENVIGWAIHEAEQKLPPGSVYEIRGKLKPSAGKSDYSRRKWTKAQRTEDWGVAWYFLPAMRDWPLMTRVPYTEGIESELGGYLIIARLRTPDG